MDTVDLSAAVNKQIAWYEYLLNQAVTKRACIGKCDDLKLDSDTAPHVEGIRSALNQLKQTRQ